MVDREKRDLLSRCFHKLLAGKISNLEYDDLDLEGKLASEDPAPWHIWEKTYLLYDDFKVHPVKLTEEGREYFARCLLFLRSDREYEWPLPTVGRLTRRLVTLLTGGMFLKFREASLKQYGDYDVWPFLRTSDLDEEKKRNLFKSVNSYKPGLEESATPPTRP